MQYLERKPDISYPCEWEYRIIGESEERIGQIVSEMVKKPYTLKVKNHSNKGRFMSMHLVVNVINEEERNRIYASLSAHQEIKMVI